MLVCIDEIWYEKNQEIAVRLAAKDINAENTNTQGFQSYVYVHVQ